MASSRKRGLAGRSGYPLERSMPAASKRLRAARGRGRVSFFCITKSLIWEEIGSGSVAEGAILVF